MSAGGLSYSMLKTKAKATLPSVEMWGSNMNILKDPPRSIHTRRIDKVGQTQSILNAQDESGDRISEAINVYARGVNPMVAVSFDNYSNNGGRSSPFQNSKSVSLPYKITTFRPPIQRQEDLLPLSRLPRTWFYSYTNPSFPDVVQAAQCNETGKSVREEILHPQATTTKIYGAVGDVPRDAASNSVLTSIPHMQTDAKLSLPQQTYLSDEYDTGAEKKSINTDKMDVIAITNKTSGEKQQDFDNLSVGKIGNAFHIQVDPNKSSFFESYQHTQFQAQDPKQIHWNKKIYEAFSQKSINKSTNLVEKMDTNKFINKNKYLCIAKTNRSSNEKFVNPLENTNMSSIPIKEYLYNNVRTQTTSVFHVPQPLSDKPSPNSLKEDPLRMNVTTTRQMKGGMQPMENAVSTISTKPYLYQDVRSQKTFHIKDNQENNRVMTHSIQDTLLLPSADTSKSFIASKNAFEGSVFEIHNQKRTPLHSVQTNTQTPYSMPQFPESIPEQKRSHPLMETSTTRIDPVQIEATRDVYRIQSRNGNNKTHSILPKGGFEGQGSAVPVFNQYENYNYSISDPARDDLRQRTVSIMESRYDPPPQFS